MTRYLRGAAALVAACMLVGCASVGLAPAQSTDESIAYGYGTYVAVEDALSTALQAGSVTKPEAIAIDRSAGQALVLLQAARLAESVDPQRASSDLALATSALTALQAWLNAPKGAPPDPLKGMP